VVATILGLWASTTLTAASQTLQRPEDDFCRIKELIGNGRYLEAKKLAHDLVARGQDPSRLHPTWRELFRQALAECCCFLGQYQEAETCYTTAAQFWRTLRPDYDVHLASNLHEQATLCGVLGRYAQAETLYKEAIEIRKGFDEGPQRDLSVASSRQGLGRLYLHLGRYSEAELWLGQALDTHKRLLPQDFPTTDSLDALAELYRCQGRLLDAERMFEESLLIYTRRERNAPAGARGMLQRRIARCHASLGLLNADLWHEQGRGASNHRFAASAEEHYQEALKILVNVIPNGPLTADCRNNRGRLYHDRAHHGEDSDANFDRAEACYREALRVLQTDQQANRHDIADTQHNMALLYYDRENISAASEELAKAARALEDDSTAPLGF
jgi:tetratricopeptide (TPR) repeat protein